MALLDKILIANRGEIALRIISSAKLLGIKTVAMYTESEKEAGYVSMADERVSLGSDDLNSTYLNIGRIISIARSTGSQAIHPGYGFLSENPDFAKACEAHQIIFIGPRSEVLKLMGNKPEAKALASGIGIPVAQSFRINPEQVSVPDQLLYPALIKASFGGGGKGMEIVNNPEELSEKMNRSSRMARNYFGNGELFVEQYIRNARHVEVQLLGDNHGHLIHLYERECSIQRNHQKIIEEAPAVFLTPALRENLLTAALKIGKTLNYSGAGTVEFLIDESGNYYFMEMNPRIQVEHAVTEQITGIDIVAEQLRIASGYPLSLVQEQVIVKGHAIELRIYTENPAQHFTPSSSALRFINMPVHPDLRIEADLIADPQIINQFDPLLLKLIALGNDRMGAIELLKSMTCNLNIIGPETNTKYLEAVLNHTDYQQNIISVEFCRNNQQELISRYQITPDHRLLPFMIAFAVAKGYLTPYAGNGSDPWKYLGYWRISPTSVPVSVDGKIYTICLNLNDRSKRSFVLGHKNSEFQIIKEAENCIEISIENNTHQIFYALSLENETIISLENSQYRIGVPGLLSNHSEYTERPDKGYNSDIWEISSPLYGKVVEIFIKENQLIKKGDLLMVIEAMKSENRIVSPRDAKIKKIAVNVGAQVADRMPLILLED
jgi:acetyl/propionyl-CoA carboxylase alpha subunit